MNLPDPLATNPIAASWHPVAVSGELSSGLLSAELLGRRLVLFRNSDGHVAALDDECPHRGTALSLGSVIDGTVACPYHGWRFGADGGCRWIPSLTEPARPPEGARATAAAVVESDGLVWVSLDPAANPTQVPAMPSTESHGGVPTGVRVITGAPMVWRTSAGRHIENILDLAHFPFVHPGTFGCKEAERVEPHDVELSADPPAIDCQVGVTTRNPDAPGGGWLYPELGPTIRLGYHYRVQLPYRITLEFEFPDGMQRALHEVVCPNAPDRCTIYWCLLVDEQLTSSDEHELAFARAVFAEDQPLIESQPPGVPIDRTAEVHVPADRLAVAYRRALREWGVPVGARV